MVVYVTSNTDICTSQTRLNIKTQLKHYIGLRESVRLGLVITRNSIYPDVFSELINLDCTTNAIASIWNNASLPF